MSHDLTVERLLDSTPEVAFDAFVDPDAQRELYADAPDWIVESECDLRVGGRWTISFGAPGTEPARETNVFEQVERPRRLVFRSTMKMPDGSNIDTHVQVSFDPENGKTRIRILQRGFPGPDLRDSFESGWGSILERLARAVLARAGGTAGPGPLERLDALIGRWKTEGTTTDPSAVPGERIDAIDTYERLPGGGLLHLVDARVGDQKVEGAEIIGYDPDRNTYVTLYFGSDGPTAYEASLSQEAEGLTWRMRSTTTRFTGIFSPDGGVITGHWELLHDSGDWRPWMEITLTREASR